MSIYHKYDVTFTFADGTRFTPDWDEDAFKELGRPPSIGEELMWIDPEVWHNIIIGGDSATVSVKHMGEVAVDRYLDEGGIVWKVEGEDGTVRLRRSVDEVCMLIEDMLMSKDHRSEEDVA